MIAQRLMFKNSIRARLVFGIGALVGSLFLALMSQVAIPLWFSPVPITLQTFGLMLLGGLFGPKFAFYTVLTYLFEGCCGLPVFAFGQSGFAVLCGPTGGYLIGFLFAAVTIGALIGRQEKSSYFVVLFSLMLGSLIIFIFGVSWLSLFLGFQKAVSLGCFPFIPGDYAKIFFAAFLLARIRKQPIVHNLKRYLT